MIASGVRYVPVDGELELLPGLRLVPRRATRGTQVVVVENGGRPVVVGGDVAVWFGELDDRTRPDAGTRARARAGLAHARARARGPAPSKASPAFSRPGSSLATVLQPGIVRNIWVVLAVAACGVALAVGLDLLVS